MLRAIVEVLLIGLDIYLWFIIATAIMSWLVLFNVVNTRNQVISMIWTFLYNITDPALRPIRAMIPPLGGMDISPIILILLILLFQKILVYSVLPLVI